MKIEIGKRYVLKDGRVTGPVVANRSGGREDYPFRAWVPTSIESPTTGGELTWAAKGKYWYDDYVGSPKDIASKFVEQPKPELAKPSIPKELEEYVLRVLEKYKDPNTQYFSGYAESLEHLLSTVYGVEAVPATLTLKPTKK